MASFQSRYKSHFVKTKSDRKIFFLRHFSKRLSDSTQKRKELVLRNFSNNNTPFFNNYCFISIFGRQKHLMDSTKEILYIGTQNFECFYSISYLQISLYYLNILLWLGEIFDCAQVYICDDPISFLFL